MPGFFLFLFCTICCFIVAKVVFNNPGLNEKIKKQEFLFFISIGIIGLFTAISCLMRQL